MRSPGSPDIRSPRQRPQRRSLFALTALLCAGAAACSPRVREVRLDPTRFVAVDVDGERKVEELDPETLYREGGAAFEGGDYRAAARKYGLVVEHFPDSRWVDVSRYNAGLALERLGRFEEALPLFAAYAERTAGTKDAHDALFRMASCYEGLERWPEVAGVFTRVLAPEFEGITPADRLEASVRRGNAHQRLGDLAEAERDYRAALDIYKEQLGHPAMAGNRFVSMAQFQIGEIYMDLFREIRFRLPLERMARDLDDKANYFLKAQNAYLRAVRLHHPDFAVAAGYRLGAIYEQFYDDMMGAEIPAELNAEEVEVYYGELRKQVEPLIEKAVYIYERNLEMAERFGGDDAWMRKTEAGLARLRDVMRQQEPLAKP